MTETRALSPETRAPQGGDGQRLFRPDATLEVLRRGERGDGERVRVAGRVRDPADGSFELRDGEASARVAMAEGQKLPGPLAWVGVEGRWDAGSRGIADARLSFLREADLGLDEAAARGLPEAGFVAEPQKLAAVAARARLRQLIRSFFAERGYLEVETPVLHSGAECSFVDQYSVSTITDRRLYLRTDPEEYLKRYLTAGLESVFEMSRNFRAERPDADHLQEFTSVECYRRFATFDDAVALCQELVVTALRTLRGSASTRLHGRTVDFDPPPAVRTFYDLVREHTDLEVAAYPTAEALAAEIRRRGWWQGTGTELDEFRTTWLEWLLDHRVLTRLEQPTFVVEFPHDVGLSACNHPQRPEVSLRGELYLAGGWELAQIYENMTEPGPLRERYQFRLNRRIAGGLGEVPLDEGLLGSSALGMPPMAGFAIGFDRLLLLILGQGGVEQGLLFPHEGFDSD